MSDQVNTVTVEHLESIIVKEVFIVIPESTVTICMLTLKNGFSVRGESACVDPNNFKKEVGETWARKDAFSKLWQLEGYLLKQRMYEAGK